MTRLETVIRHASGALELVIATGLAEHRHTVGGVVQTDPGPLHGLRGPVDFVLEEPRRGFDFRIRSGRVAILARDPSPMRISVERTAAIDLEPPPEAPFDVGGTIAVRSGAVLPRRVRREIGGAARRPVPLHLAPQVVAGPALSARVAWDGGAPASWALLRLDVAIENGDPAERYTLLAQADRRGEARIPISALPRAVTPPEATLTVRADPAASDRALADPDTFPAVDLRDPTSASFAADATFTIDPTSPGRLASMGSTTLVLRPS